jgi:protocatechuate 3,4-dioxygenase beta subunit
MIASFRPQKRRGLLTLLVLSAVGPACLTDAQVSKPKSAKATAPALASEKDNASRCATWQRSVSYGSNGRPLQPEINIYSKLPKEVTMRLDPGISIGGAVVDDRGKPLAGVRVLVSTCEYYDFNRHSFFYSPEVTPQDKAKPAAVTDAQGRWTFSHFPSDLEPVEISFVRPDESSESFATVEGIAHHRTLVPFDKLADRTAVFKLGNGVTVRGRVVDEKGKPLNTLTNAKPEKDYRRPRHSTSG